MPLPNGQIGVNNNPLVMTPFVGSGETSAVTYDYLVDQNNVAVVNQDHEKITFPVSVIS